MLEHEYLVLSIYLQKAASIHPRTSPTPQVSMKWAIANISCTRHRRSEAVFYIEQEHILGRVRYPLSPYTKL